MTEMYHCAKVGSQDLLLMIAEICRNLRWVPWTESSYCRLFIEGGRALSEDVFIKCGEYSRRGTFVLLVLCPTQATTSRR